ncbi:protein kinase domain-containing protein [Cryobacterium serini]|uniref:protein kinase domain-containing protein n=1 Tax=Cryobacterium serini TaxID=1259201 RepID=UPI00141B5694|nr:protein kinase [Cryobacterium serini]
MRRRAERSPATVDETHRHESAQQASHQDADDADVDPSTAASVHTEGVVAGHRVIRLLGAGDRAVVYLGHSGAGSLVALKVFHAATETASIELDITVLTSAAAPGLVRLLDVAQVSDGRICLILERLAGGSLARYLVEHPSLSPGEVVTLLAPITVALNAMHTAGFAHGGVTQSTILLDANGRAVLTGFGAVMNLNDAPRDRIQRLRADYERLAVVMVAVFESVAKTDPHRESGAALMRRFQAAINPSAPPARPAQAPDAAHPGSILGRLEYDLFEWADAEPLHGFDPDDRRDAQGVTANTAAVETKAVQVNGVQLRHSALHTDPAGPRASDDKDFGHETPADPTGGKLDNAVSSQAYRPDERADELVEDFDESFDDRWPRDRFAFSGGVLRNLSGRGATLLRALQPRARLGRVIPSVVYSVVDSHPLNSAGHALRKRLHGHHRPLLVATVGGASILMLALALFPVSGRAGETGPPRVAATAGAAPVNNTPGPTDGPTIPNDLPVDTAGSASQAAIAGDDPVAAVLVLLGRRAACLLAASLVCLVDVDQTGSAILASDSYDARERQQGLSGRDIADYSGYVPSLAERSGDLAVVALTPASGEQKSQPASILVVKGEDGWRLREIFDY